MERLDDELEEGRSVSPKGSDSLLGSRALLGQIAIKAGCLLKHGVGTRMIVTTAGFGCFGQERRRASSLCRTVHDDTPGK
jgi:hypothetical protein